MATAQVLFQRFWYVTSMKQFGIKVRESEDGRGRLGSDSDHLLRTSAWVPSFSRPSSKSRQYDYETLSMSTTFYFREQHTIHSTIQDHAVRNYCEQEAASKARPLFQRGQR